MAVARQFAELLMDVKFHTPEDKLRKRHGFSDDVAQTNAILFSRSRSRLKKINAYRKWLESNQPCVFGRVAAKNANLFICLLEEREVLTMKCGDADLRDTIRDYRQVWKRYALDGAHSAFVVLLVSESIIDREPGAELKELARRFMELYMDIPNIADDTIIPQREYVFLRESESEGLPRIRKFSTLPNIFCAQGDGRWWRDHRTPGGLMITSNPLGHFTYVRSKQTELTEQEKLRALENAMRTIGNAYPGLGGRPSKGLRHCPATHLIPRAEEESSPLKKSSDYAKYSPDHYSGFFNTDHLIPSVFFRPERDPDELIEYDNLGFRYIYDAALDPKDHGELMTGVDASMYEVKINMDRLPSFVDPETTSNLNDRLRGRLFQWLEKRLNDRLS